MTTNHAEVSGAQQTLYARKLTMGPFRGASSAAFAGGYRSGVVAAGASAAILPSSA
jgi:hypothetical protein